jgi:cytoskeletal protein CcmA (bactofilin family)
MVNVRAPWAESRSGERTGVIVANVSGEGAIVGRLICVEGVAVVGGAAVVEGMAVVEMAVVEGMAVVEMAVVEGMAVVEMAVVEEVVVVRGVGVVVAEGAACACTCA